MNERKILFKSVDGGVWDVVFVDPTPITQGDMRIVERVLRVKYREHLRLKRTSEAKDIKEGVEK